MSAEPVRAYVGIGEVIARLRSEFPDVSVSKIRFLETEGLIQPARSPSGYRKFTPADVDRLRYILTLQRDRYLPLRVIKDQLAAGEDETATPASGERRRPRPSVVQAVQDPPGAASGHERTAGYSRRDLLDATGIDEPQLAELEGFGLVRRIGRVYPPEALDAVRAVSALGRYGLHGRHLRSLRAAAERETALIEQVVAPILRQHNPGARDRAGQAAREIATYMLAAHTALIEMTLADAGFGDPGGGNPDL